MEKDIHIICREIKMAISDLELDLNGLSILTEAASGLFAFSPIIALMAGAKKVHAVLKTTKYGTFDEIKERTVSLAKEVGGNVSNLEIIEKNKFENFRGIDIVCNLGHVRPIDRFFIGRLKEDCVITYMCEAWEHREGDIDLDFCRERGIAVYGMNEEHPKINCFFETGLIALKMIFESGVSISNARVLIVSRDKFGKEISKQISKYTDRVVLIDNFNAMNLESFAGLDLLIVADYLYPDIVIGENGVIRPSLLKEKSPYVKVIQYCGSNSIDDMTQAGISYYPDVKLEAVRMYKTLADISYRALIRLYAGGLKVGEIARRGNESSNAYHDIYQRMDV